MQAKLAKYSVDTEVVIEKKYCMEQPHDLVEKGCHIKELVSVGSDAKGVKGASAAARSWAS